jgi:hypothetical protein
MQYKGLQCQPCCGDGEHQAAARDLNMIKVHQGVTRDEILKGQLFILFSMNRTISFLAIFYLRAGTSVTARVSLERNFDIEQM